MKVLHITNHIGTIRNIQHVFSCLFPEENRERHLQTMNCRIPANVSQEYATQFWKDNKDYICANYDTIIFTDTSTYARPFLQNIKIHDLKLVIYITNRVDWLMREDTVYKTLCSELSTHSRVFFCADNKYDQYYASLYGIQFRYHVLRLCPRLTKEEQRTTESINRRKLFVYNRGTEITRYSCFLDIEYDVFGPEPYKRYKDESEIGEYMGYLHLPYQTNIQSLYENLGHSIIYFLPSLSFLLNDLLFQEWYYWEEKGKNKEEVIKSVILSEWYQPENTNLFVYFNNWQHLSELFKDQHIDWREKKRHIRIHMEQSNQVSIALWKQILSESKPEESELKPEETEPKPEETELSLLYKTTIVSAFYDVRKMEKNEPQYNRGIDIYLKLAKEFLFTLPYPMMLFIDEKESHSELYQLLRESTASNRNIKIIVEPFSQTYFYKYLNRTRDLQSTFHIINGDVHHETPHYIALNNNKFHFLEKAIERNDFHSTHFMWLDFGINHVAKNPEMIHEWFSHIHTTDKIKQLCINPFVEPVKDIKSFFQYIYHHLAGGLFSGSISHLRQYISLFKQKIDDIYNQGWYQIDEAIMTMIQREHEELFDLFYGDYEAIISNYNRPVHSIPLIFTSLKKASYYNHPSFVSHISAFTRKKKRE